MNTLTLNDLHISMPTRCLLEKLDLQLTSGQFWAILGPNGVGKSSLLRVLAGLARPQRGSLTWNNQNLSSLTPRKRASIVSWLPQDHFTTQGLSVADFIALGAYHRQLDLSDSNIVNNVTKLLKQWSLQDHKDKSLADISGGERQRAALAQIALQATPIVLLDEPTNHLDIGHQIAVMRYLQQRAQAGDLIIAILHDVNLARRFCTHALLYENPSSQAIGTIEHICDSAHLSQLYQQTLSPVVANGYTWFVPGP